MESHAPDPLSESKGDGGGDDTGLMTALSRPRKSFKTHGLMSTKVGLLSPVPPDKLPVLRVDDRSEIRRALGAEADDVRALPAKVSAEFTGSSRLDGVRRMTLARKLRHDNAIKEYEAVQRALYSEAEDEVLRCGRELRAGLLEVDARQARLFEVLKDDAVLVANDFAWLQEQHAAVDALGRERRQLVTQFADAMERVEANRAGVLGARLRSLAETLVAVGHELQPAIERTVDAFAGDVNATVVGNKREHAHALAELQRVVLITQARAASQWDAAEVRWREHRHANAIERFSQALQVRSACGLPGTAPSESMAYPGARLCRAPRLCTLRTALRSSVTSPTSARTGMGLSAFGPCGLCWPCGRQSSPCGASPPCTPPSRYGRRCGPPIG